MIATRRGLIIACSIALVLAIVVIVDGMRSTAPADRAIAPGLVAERVTRLAWTRAPSSDPPGSSAAPPARAIELVRSGERWTWVEPPGTADAATIGEVLAALRGARWHRRADREAAGAIGATLRVTSDAGVLELAIGQPLAGAEQLWIVTGEHALLVDAWVARALVPDPLALRVRAPLAGAPTARRIQLSPGGDLGRVTLEGAPRRLVQPMRLWLDPSLAAILERALAELVVTALPSGTAAPIGEGIAVDDVIVRDAGPCPGSPERWAIDGTHGAGCVERSRWDEVKRATYMLTAPVEQLVERRPVPIEPAKLVLADATTLDLTARPQIGDRDADPVRVAELLAALAAPAQPVALPTTPVTATIAVTDRGRQTIELDLYRDGILARRGEPVALKLGAGAWAIATRPSRDLRDPTLWREEPTTIAKLELDGTTYARGAALGEWTRTGPGRDDPAAVDRLVAALAAPQATPRAHAGTVRHTATLHVTPVGGAPVTHAIQLGDVEAGRCNAVVAGERVQVAAQVCTLAASLAR